MLTSRYTIAFSFLAMTLVSCHGLESNQVREARRATAAKARIGPELGRAVFLTELELDERRAALREAEAQLERLRTQRGELIRELDLVLETVAALEEDLMAAKSKRASLEAEIAAIPAASQPVESQPQSSRSRPSK